MKRRDVDQVELRLGCGSLVTLLVLVNTENCRNQPCACLDAREIARVILFEVHREDIPEESPR